ncbi:uncharacterized protein LOC116015902 [Ipomoea triloba]|uniref:uncharacterized protein LOC116015902 n=1 Tax=Ipomoea triloba TaxID=35885 RepID=UPI00125E5C08|nr:uncharacterized protein LOC116015902 [Ipomoea triloba]
MERKVCWIFQQTREIKAAFSKDNHIDSTWVAPNKSELHWSPPQDGWFVINTDVSFTSPNNPTGYGAVLKDNTGAWIGGFSCRVKAIMPQKENAVLSIVHLGGHGEKGEFEILGPARDIVHACKDWVQRNWVVKITHIHRDHNRVDDRLARIAVREGRDWIEFGAPPNDARKYYEEDRLGALAHNVLF